MDNQLIYYDTVTGLEFLLPKSEQNEDEKIEEICDIVQKYEDNIVISDKNMIRKIFYKTCKFMIKKEFGQWIVYSEDNKIHKCLDKINCISIINKYDLDNLTSLIIKMCDKYLDSKDQKISFDKNKINNVIISINEENKIRSLINQSIKNNPKELILFDRKRSADIIVCDYMKIYNEITSGIFLGSLSLNEQSIYEWKIILNGNSFNKKLTKELEEWAKKKNVDPNITLTLTFHPDLYPNSPPTIKIISPSFNDNLSNRIMKSKFTKLEYWDSGRTPLEIITRTKKVIDDNGSISMEYTNKNHNSQKQLDALEKLLIEITSCFDINVDDPIDKDHRQKRKNVIIDRNVKNKKDKLNTGTGYGYYGAPIWDPKEHEKNIKNKSNNFINIINNLNLVINSIFENEKGDISCTIDIIKKSIMYEYLINCLDSVSILEITNNSAYYRSIFDFLLLYCLDNGIGLFYDSDNKKSMYHCIEKLHKKAILCLEINNENENANIIINIYNMISQPYSEYLITIKQKNCDINKKKLNSNSNPNPNPNPYPNPIPNPNPNICNDQIVQDVNKNENVITRPITFIDTMNLYKCKIGVDLHNDINYYYKSKACEDNNMNMKTCYKRMSSEIPVLIESLQVNNHGIALIYIDKQKPNCIRYLLSGPLDTPYAYGLFIFDSYTSHQYPLVPPEFHLMNTSGLRFNPNLYQDGLVCLSLLGTYVGPKPDESEKWNPNISTLSQVILSIQSQIFVDHPFFNEPGYENKRGTSTGNIATKIYNENIQYATMRAAIIDLIKSVNQYPQFKNAILTYFFLKRDKIIEQCKKWSDEASGNWKVRMQELINEMNEVFKYPDPHLPF